MGNGTKIKSVKIYQCGYCINNLGSIYSNYFFDNTMFYALAFLIEHKELGYMLYDAGYSDRIHENGIVSKVYNKLNKTVVTTDIVRQLECDGIKPCDIKHIILSHAHPDHIGCLKDFDYTKTDILSTQDVLDTLHKHKLKNLVFKNMVPEHFVCRAVDTIRSHHINDEVVMDFIDIFGFVMDIFGDGSLFGVRLDGHAKGQLGIYIPDKKLFLAADAAWGKKYIDDVIYMKAGAKRIQNNFEMYLNTIDKIQKLMAWRPEIDVIFSHDNRGLL